MPKAQHCSLNIELGATRPEERHALSSGDMSNPSWISMTVSVHVRPSPCNDTLLLSRAAAVRFVNGFALLFSQTT